MLTREAAKAAAATCRTRGAALAIAERSGT
jgi:hypothetical protein